MDLTQPQESGPFQAGYHAEHPLLLSESQVILKADHVVAVGLQGFLSQLYGRVRSTAGSGIGEADRLHGAETKGVDPAAGHLLDGEAGLEIEALLALVERHRFGMDQGLVKCQVLLPIERAIQVVRSTLAVSGTPIGLFQVDAVGFQDGADGIVEVEVIFAHEFSQRSGERRGSQGAGGHNGRTLGRQVCDLFAYDFNPGASRQGFGHCRGESFPVHRKRSSAGDSMAISKLEQQGIQCLQLLLEQPGGCARLVRLEGVAADNLGQMGRLVGKGVSGRPHFTQPHGETPPCNLPGRLGTRQAAADDQDRFHER